MSNEEIKEFIQNTMTGVNARIESKYEIIDLKLDGINEHLKTLNGKVAKHEKIINEAILEREKNRVEQKNFFENRENSCPINKEVQDLKQQTITAKALKKYNAKLFFISTTIIGIIIAVLGVWLKKG